MRFLARTGRHRTHGPDAALHHQLQQRDELIRRQAAELAKLRTQQPAAAPVVRYVPVAVPASHLPYRELTATSFPRHPALTW